MSEVKKLEADDFFTISFHTVDVILWDWTEDRRNALIFYIQCSYLNSHWLPLDDIDWYDKEKDILTNLWLIKIIRDDFEGKDYVEVYYLV